MRPRAGDRRNTDADVRPSRWDDPRWRSFVRGVAIGAVIGAIVAGSSFWRRRSADPQAEEGG
jgi:hypothetical protein